MRFAERIRHVPHFLRPAVLSLAFNLPLGLAGVQRTAYDTYTHIFFADHYRLDWFELREFRWYAGFSLASYPPLVHQVIALLSGPLSAVAAWFAPPATLPGLYRYRGEELGYVIALLVVLASLPYAVRDFARIFVGPVAARRAGYLTILCPAIGLAAWSFGQLPTLAATTLFLFALAQGYRYSRFGERPALLRALAFAGAAAGAHHAALFFLVFAGAAVCARAVLSCQVCDTKTPGQRDAKFSFVSSRLRAFVLKMYRGTSLLFRPTLRAIVWAALTGLVVVVVLWPFLEWSAGYQPQTPIDHASRHSFLADPIVTFTFFWPAYGIILLLIPWALAVGVRLRRLWPLTALFALFFTLGLGGTTPLPKWLFGANWQWLTYDRFALWAGISLLPFAGALIVKFRRHLVTPTPLRPCPPVSAPPSLSPASALPHRLLSHRTLSQCSLSHCSLFIASLLLASALYGSLLSVITRAQPPALDLVPVAEFLAEGANDQWRYLTLGFGDQAARLATLTTAGTPDGAYHTARELPALRESGVAQLGSLVWQPVGVEGVRSFLASAADPQEWAVRWIFVNHPAYEPILRETGWRFDRVLSDGVELWRKERVWPVAPWTLVGSGPTLSARWWGSAPLAALALAIGLGSLDDTRLRRAARAVPAFLFYSLMLVFPIGWHEVIRVSQTPGVFLAYRSVLAFASDYLLLLLLAAWLVERWLSAPNARRLRWGPPTVGLAWLGLLAAAAISVPRSFDPSLSTAFFFHLALLGGLYLYLQTEPPAWGRIALLLIVQLAIQGTLGLLEFSAQSTTALGPLRLPFVAALTPNVSGASVVQTADGTRWLRAYGSLWHPNVLGAVLLLCFAGPLLEGTKRKGGNGRNASSPSSLFSVRSFVSLSSLSLALGAVTLALSFSRSAWLGGLVAAAVLVLRMPRAERRRLRQAAALSALALVVLVIAFSPLFFTRATADARSPLERFSVEDRASVARVALRLARDHLWTGVGAGAFVQAMAADPAITVTREPVHDVPLLVLAETGLPGALALAGLGLAIGYEMIRRRPASPQAHVFTALFAGLLFTALFDHFLWSSFPGRSLAVLMLSLWAAASQEDRSPI